MKLKLVGERVIEVATGVGVGVEVPELGAVVLSPPQAANSKATPTNSLYRCITSSQDQDITCVYCRKAAQPKREVRMIPPGNPVYGDVRTQVFSTQV